MNLEYTQLIYSKETEQKLFPNYKEEGNLSLVVLDSANLNKGKLFDSENDKILNFLTEQNSYKENSVLYDFVITKTGVIYKLTPEGKCGTSLTFDLYSEYASKLLPLHCPQTDGKIYKHEKFPDQVAASILVECDNDPNTNIDSGILTECTKDSVEDILAYYIKNYGIQYKNIIGRYRLPKTKDDINRTGPSFFKHDPVLQILSISYAVAIARNEHNISIFETDTLQFN